MVVGHALDNDFKALGQVAARPAPPGRATFAFDRAVGGVAPWGVCRRAGHGTRDALFCVRLRGKGGRWAELVQLAPTV